jgi:hypothetical protein
MGLSLDQVEGLVSRKAETITPQLLRCFSMPDQWGRIVDRLVTTCGVSSQEMRELSVLLERVRKGEATFHAPQRRESGAKIRIRSPKSSRRKIAEATAQAAQAVARLQQLTPAESELLRQKLVRRLLGKARIAPHTTRQVKYYRATLRARIESVLGCEIVVTPSGSFYRAFGDARVDRRLKKVRDFDAAKGEPVVGKLSELERVVVGQVRRPNELAHAHAYLEGARGRKPTPDYTEKMTLACLAQGLEMDLGLFIDVLMAVGQSLRE